MNKRLQRDTQNKVIGGVCSGLANYFDIDASLVRLLFAIAFLVFSSGFWIYLILWIIMPAGSGVQAAEMTDGVVSDVTETSKKNKGSLVAGLILIGIGLIGLLHIYIPEISWEVAWPILLILLGIFLIVPINRKLS